MIYLTMTYESKKTLMRNLGEFVGHIVRAVKTEPNKKVIRKEVEETKHGNLTLRRTTIDEIELPNVHSQYDK